MADTENFTWTKPTVGGDNNAWGEKLNILFDDIDEDLQTLADAVETVIAESAASAALLNNDATVVKYIGAEAFQSTNDEDDIVYNGTFVRSDDDTGSDFYAAFSLPQGAYLTQIDLYCDKNARTSVTLTVYKVSITGVRSTLGTGTRSASGVGVASATGIDHTVVPEFLKLYVTAAGTGDYRIYGAKITYTRHSLTETD